VQIQYAVREPALSFTTVLPLRVLNLRGRFPGQVGVAVDVE